MTNTTTTQGHPHPEHPAILAFRSLPEQEHYVENYQPTYSNPDELLDAMLELHKTEPVTTPRQIDALQEKLTLLAKGEISEPIIVTGRCAEEVSLATEIDVLVEQAVSTRSLVFKALGKAIVVLRNRGQATKPRSTATETLPNGKEVVSYMGDAVNGAHKDHREPDPTRMVATAVQSRDLEAGLTREIGKHVPAAHEALLLPYEHSFVRTDPETGKKYLLSADLPWIGKRTNAINGEHVRLLAQVENPVGIKIGPDSTADHIAELQAVLNPTSKPGKLVFMMRVGLEQQESLDTILGAIRTYAPNAIIMYDIHGVTRTAPTGQKIRYTGDIIEDVCQTAVACRKEGLKLHGVHLETIADESRLECVDHPDQLPTHPGGVDPQLNPRQTKYVLERIKEFLL